MEIEAIFVHIDVSTLAWFNEEVISHRWLDGAIPPGTISWRCEVISMPSFQHIVGHAAIKQVLAHAVVHPASGYVLYGPSGLGKSLLANAFAEQLLHIPERAAALEAHPDFVRLLPADDEASISVETVRAFVASLHETPIYGRRVALIERADQLNEASFNALLKDVEESRSTVFIFTAERIERLPATLRSRLVQLPLTQVPKGEMVEWLKARNVPSNQIDLITNASRGCPGRALELIEKQTHEHLTLARSWLNVMSSGSVGERLNIIEQIARRCDRAEDSIGAWRQFVQSVSLVWSEQSKQASNESHAKLGEGLTLISRSIGTSLPMRSVLEWLAMEPYNEHNRKPSMLFPSYL